MSPGLKCKTSSKLYILEWKRNSKQRNYTKLHSHQLNMRISIALHSHQDLVLPGLSVFANGGWGWYPIRPWFSFSWLQMEVGHLCICLQMFVVFSSVKSLSMYFIHHSIWLSFSYWLICYFFWEWSFVRWVYCKYLP